MKKNLLFIFFLIAFLNLLGEATQNLQLIFYTKPLLMITLAGWFFTSTRDDNSTIKKNILLALLFSFGGDTLLMFIEQGPKQEQFFLYGLGSFLMAQICYTLGFFNYGKGKTGFLKQKPFWILPVFLYFIFIIFLLWPHLSSALKTPIFIYSLAICSMALGAINMKDLIPDKYWIGLIIGVVLFIASDSMIAINKFVESFTIPYPRVSIMLTYIIAQFLIVSCIKNAITTD